MIATPPTIAYFISDHGFGHASRSAAVMAALEQQSADVRFELFTTCHPWIFEDSLSRPFGYHKVRTDVGMVQLSPLEEDADATVLALNRFLPFDPEAVMALVQQVKQLGCRMIVCDIAPLGVAVAKGAGLPCVLVENFTWDFIYEPYMAQAPELEPHIYYLKTVFSQADRHIQAVPVCRPAEKALLVPPISRKPRTAPGKIREQLAIPEKAKMVLVSMGGVQDQFRFLQQLPDHINAHVVIPSANGMHVANEKVTLLPTRSQFFHPDLLNAADLLVGKAGYSTVAEAVHAGIPFAYVARAQSPESTALEQFITEKLPSWEVGADAYASGQWIGSLTEWLAAKKVKPPAENGADVVARELLATFS